VNAEAQDLYFRGVHAIRSGGAGATRRAIGYFQQAIQKDPNFARAYSGLALAYSTWYPEDPSPRDNMPKARDAATKALALDDSLVYAHIALAYVAMLYDWNWAEAEREFRRALELDPNNALARSFYARELVALGRTEEGVSQAARAVEIEPYWGLDYPAWVYYLAHRYDESLQLAQKMVAMDPNFSWGRWALAANYEQLGKPREASEEYLRFETLSGTNEKRIHRLREGLEKSGVKGFWQASLADYRKTAKSKYVPPVLAAGACARLGDKACTFEWLEKGFQERDDLMIDLKVDPVFDGIHDDPRFQDLVRRVGLP
jgi:tetratricopeptide (TPR) repeat protein